MPRIVVRDAVLGDATDIGRVHVAAWRAAYRGIMAPAFLASLDPTERSEDWAAALEANPVPSTGRRLVVEVDEVIVGVSVVSPARGDDEQGLGELLLINVEPESWGVGAATMLLAADVDALRDLGFSEAILWVVSENPRARRFYEREGWRADGASKSDEIGGAEVIEVRYRRAL